MRRRFVLVSGLPGSGKSTLARRLAQPLHLPVLDKDDILERLFDAEPAVDAVSRRRRSRESDAQLQMQARASDGAILVSFWHVPGMALNSGTSTARLSELDAAIVHVECACRPEVAARRFLERRRHLGHLDDQRSFDEVLESLDAHARLGHVSIEPRLVVDTSREPPIEELLRNIQEALRASPSQW
jgi:predicted kinase